MCDKLRKFVASILVFSIMIGTVGLTGGQKAYANENNASSPDGIMLTEEEVNTYKGIDLASTQFDTSKMNEKERELYDLLLEREYETQKASLDEQGIRKEEFINGIKSFLHDEYSVDGDVIVKSKAKKATRIISVGNLGSALNVAITAALIATGVGSIGELVKKLGKQGAKRWVKKHLSSKIAGVLARVGAKKLGKWIGAFVVSIVDTYLEPGTFLAKKFDSVDAVPNSGYIELW